MRQCQAGALAMHAQQFGGAIVFPALGQAGDAGFQCRQAEIGCCIFLGAHQIVDACLRAVGEHGRELDRLAIECGHQLVADANPQFGVEAVTWHKHQCRGEAAKRVAAQEQAGALAFLQAQDADRVFG